MSSYLRLRIVISMRSKGSNGKLSGFDKRRFSDFVSSLGVVGGLESRFMFNERLLSLPKEQLRFVALSQ